VALFTCKSLFFTAKTFLKKAIWRFKNFKLLRRMFKLIKKTERDANKVHYGGSFMYAPAELMGQKQHAM
jgi:hypothetical protein